MSVHDCEVALRETAVELRPLLDALGFEFQIEQAGRGRQPFATGFFVRGDVKIGFIYREKSNAAITLGSVNYENDATNVSHDQLMSSLGLVSRQRLRYDQNTFTSVAADGGNVIDALREDLVTLQPVLGDDMTLAQVIGEARRKGEQAKEESAAAKTAKREEWLRRRRGSHQ